MVVHCPATCGADPVDPPCSGDGMAKRPTHRPCPLSRRRRTGTKTAIRGLPQGDGGWLSGTSRHPATSGHGLWEENGRWPKGLMRRLGCRPGRSCRKPLASIRGAGRPGPQWRPQKRKRPAEAGRLLVLFAGVRLRSARPRRGRPSSCRSKRRATTCSPRIRCPKWYS